MNLEDNFLNTENPDEAVENADVLDSEPEVVEEYPSVGNYDKDGLRNAIREARD